MKLGPLLRFIFAESAAMTIDKAKERSAVADAKIREAKARQLEDDNFSKSDADDYVTNRLLPVRQRIDALAGECCARCNPADPDLARGVLDLWSRETIRIVRAPDSVKKK